MTGTEFKAWLDGYLENIEGRPTRGQLDRIKEKAGEIQAEPSYAPWVPWYPWTYTVSTPTFTDPHPNTCSPVEITWTDTTTPWCSGLVA